MSMNRRVFTQASLGAALTLAGMPSRGSEKGRGEPPRQIGMKSRAPARKMAAFRLEDLPTNVRDLVLTLHCLQGLVNRSQPRLYLIQDRYDELWLQWLQERGDIDEVRYLDIAELFDTFMPAVSCMYVTDPAIPASVNVATMLAACHDGLVVTPAMAGMFRLSHGAYPDSYKVGADLRVMHWKKDVDAYRWAFSEVGSEVSRRAVCLLDPETAAIRDYLVEFKVPILWISNPEQQTEPRHSFAEERDYVREIFMRWPPNIPCLGWPLDKSGIGEWEGVRLASQCAKFEVCSGNDGYSPTVSNLSVHSGTTASLKQRASPPQPLLDTSKVYIAFTRSDGDGLNFQRHYYRKLFDDPQHGNLPIGWQMGALATDLNPAILDYYYQHAKPGDCFLNALTGIGYIHEDSYADNYPAEHREQIWRDYLAMSCAYMARLDASCIATFAEMQPSRLGLIAGMDRVRAVFANYGTTSSTRNDQLVARSAGKPIFRAVGGGTNEYTFTAWGRQRAVEGMIAEVRRFTPNTRPAFMHVFLANWLSHMEMADAIAAGLGPSYVPARADHLVDLYGASKSSG